MVVDLGALAGSGLGIKLVLRALGSAEVRAGTVVPSDRSPWGMQRYSLVTTVFRPFELCSPDIAPSKLHSEHTNA